MNKTMFSLVAHIKLLCLIVLVLGGCDRGTYSTLDDLSFSDLKLKADTGNVPAEHALGLRYLRGEGIEKNLKEAIVWFQKAAAKGDASAQNDLGVCYAKGEGVFQSYDLAFKFFQLSAQQGWSEAQFNLGIMYHCGYGVPKDPLKAKEFFVNSSYRGIHKSFSSSVDKKYKKILHDDKKHNNDWVRHWSYLGI